MEYGYDAQGRLKTLNTWQDYGTGTSGAGTTWVYDGATGRLLQKQDAVAQIVRIGEVLANGRLLYTQVSGYDATGRMTDCLTAPIPQPYAEAAMSAVYNADDQMTTMNGTALGYDADGNLLPDGACGNTGASSGATGALGWDVRNRLTSVTRSGSGQVISYAYDS